MKNKAEKIALALAFGVVMHGSVISGIPGGVPGLTKTLACATCSIKMSKGLPTAFAPYMTEAQKKAFKQARKENK